jgi:hypothetical protein
VEARPADPNQARAVEFRRLTLPTGEDRAQSIANDSADAFRVSAWWMGDSLSLTLRAPDGSTVDPARAAIDANIQYTLIEDSSTTSPLRLAAYEIAMPEVGVWTAVTEAGGAPPEGIEYTLSGTVDSPIAMIPLTEPLFHQGELPFLKCAILDFTDPDTPAPVGAATVIVEVTQPDLSTASVELFDDGEHGDDAAGDGIFTGFFTGLSQPGDHRLLYRAAGVTPEGAQFQRVEFGDIFVSSGVGYIAEILTEEANDLDSNGYVDEIAFGVLIPVERAGDYCLTGELADSEGNVVAAASQQFSREGESVGMVNLHFELLFAVQSGEPMTFTLQNLQLFEVGEERLSWIDRYWDSHETQSYQLIPPQPQLAVPPRLWTIYKIP